MINKQTFRKQQIEKMTAGKDLTQKESINLTQQLLQTAAWQNAATIATTISGPIEVDTQALIKAALSQGKQVLLPKTRPHRQMAFLPYEGKKETLVISSFGIPEPVYDEKLVNQAPDLVIVPAIAFDINTRNRIGFGAGYYDRFLSQYHGQTVGLVPSVMDYKKAIWPLQKHDVQIGQLITIR